MCHRFGMKALQKANAAFNAAKEPIACCAVCDKVYASMPAAKEEAPKEPLALLQMPKLDNHKCKVTCQRFGMKMLAKQSDKFEGCKDPTQCVKICDEVYP